MTKRLADKDIATLVSATQKKEYVTGDTIIQFGDVGEEYFILESGTVDVSVYNEEGTEVVNNKTLGAGIAFGELALLYNSPRSATILAAEACVAWVMDRMTFKSIIMSTAVR